MSIFSVSEYVKARESYDYNATGCRLEITQTGKLINVGKIEGIFSSKVDPQYPNGINLRKFECVCQEIFADSSNALMSGSATEAHVQNMKNVAEAIIYWKMASQNGRAKRCIENLKAKWNGDTIQKLVSAYSKMDMAQFRIGGVRIPTATAFMRFLFPNQFGIMDSQAVLSTQEHHITNLSLRSDGYINDTKLNLLAYKNEYIPFLVKEANEINNRGAIFSDVNEDGEKISVNFRPCDIEMALYQIHSKASTLSKV